MNEILEMNGDIYCNHLHGSRGVTEKIKKAMYESAKQFVYIGFLLKEVKDYEYYKEGKYEDVYTYAEIELGFKRSSTKNFIAIAETFGIQEWTYEGIQRKSQSMSLQPAYEKFNYSQLVELLAMSPAQRQAAKPDMTVREFRSIKQKDREEAEKTTPQVTPILPQEAGQTSGQRTKANIDWVSINEGLPESEERVLVCCETKKGQRSINLAYWDGKAWHGNGSMAGVTHWQRLPRLPMLTGAQETTQAVVINNYWDDIHPDIIRRLLKVAHEKYSPKGCYKIEIKLKSNEY